MNKADKLTDEQKKELKELLHTLLIKDDNEKIQELTANQYEESFEYLRDLDFMAFIHTKNILSRVYEELEEHKKNLINEAQGYDVVNKHTDFCLRLYRQVEETQDLLGVVWSLVDFLELGDYLEKAQEFTSKILEHFNPKEG